MPVTVIAGQKNGGGNIDELLLKMYGGEVLSSYDAYAEMEGKVTVRTTKKGRSVDIPVLGKASASYHTPGEELFGQASKQTVRNIAPDRMLVSPHEFYDMDEMLTHFETRSHYAGQSGRAIALEADRHKLQTVMLAALDVSEDKDFINKAFEAADPDNPTANECNVDAGTPAATDYDADEIFSWVKAIALRFDERFVPDVDRYMGLTPRHFQTLATAFNANGGGFYLAPEGRDGKAVTHNRRMLQLEGINLMPMHSLQLITRPSHFSVNTETRKGKKYGGKGASDMTGGLTATDPYFSEEFFKVKAVAWTPDAAGHVINNGLTVEAGRDYRRMQDFVNAKMACGNGVLNPDAAIVVKAP